MTEPTADAPIERRQSKRHSKAVAEEHTEPERKRVKTEDLIQDPAARGGPWRT